MSEEVKNKRLGKIVALAKFGIGGEKDTALRMVREICEAQNLSFDEVMGSDQELQNYWIAYKDKGEDYILTQVAFKYATSEEQPSVWGHHYLKRVLVKCTPEQFVEFKYAAKVYLAAFRKQKRMIMEDLAAAFVMKNSIYGEQYKSDENLIGDGEEKQKTNEDYARDWRRANLAESLEHVPINKAIGDGS